MIKVNPGAMRLVADDLDVAAGQVPAIGDDLASGMTRAKPAVVGSHEPSCFEASRRCERQFAELCLDYEAAVKALARQMRTSADDHERFDATMAKRFGGHKP